MRWRGEKESNNIEDRRGNNRGKKIAFGGGTIGIIILLIGLFSGKDISELLNFLSPQTSTVQQTPAGALSTNENDTTAHLVSVVLKSTEEVWSQIFRQKFNRAYTPPTLVMFEQQTQSGCGGAYSQMGPFYCPLDKKVYIDLSFCNELRNRFHAPGNFAIAYVVAHEVGHHVQDLLGISEQVQKMKNRVSEKAYNQLSVKLELQADFLAGIWAQHAEQMRGIIESGDLEVALTAANAIGDDKLQMQAQGYVVPDAFTHGTSQQRMYWFKKGFETGDLRLGNFDNIQ